MSPYLISCRINERPPPAPFESGFQVMAGEAASPGGRGGSAEGKTADATSAVAMKVTAPDLLELKIVDEVIPEPIGGAHRHPAEIMRAVGNAIEKHLIALEGLSPDALRKQRRERFLAIGRMENGG